MQIMPGTKKKSSKTSRPKGIKQSEQFAAIEAAAGHIQAVAAKLKASPRSRKEKELLGRHVKQLLLESFRAMGKKENGGDNQSPDVDMDKFFTGVAGSLIAAQKQLDINSAEYISEVSGTQFLLPSVFRIPKLSAEMKFAVNKADEHGVNLFFFKDLTTDQASNQQSVQFDIVAAPLPPDIPRSPVLVAVLLDASTRTNVLAKITTPPWTSATANKVLIYQIRNGEFLLSFADNTNVGLWYANLNDGGGQAVLRPFSAAGNEATPFQATVLALGQQQADFLRSRG